MTLTEKQTKEYEQIKNTLTGLKHEIEWFWDNHGIDVSTEFIEMLNESLQAYGLKGVE